MYVSRKGICVLEMGVAEVDLDRVCLPLLISYYPH